MKEMTPQQRSIGTKHLRENWRKYGTIRNPIFADTTEYTDYIETYSMQAIFLLLLRTTDETTYARQYEIPANRKENFP